MLTKDEDKLAETISFLPCPISHTTASIPQAFVKYEQQQLPKVAARATATYGSRDASRAALLVTFENPNSQLLNATGSSRSFRDTLNQQTYMKNLRS